MSRPAQKSVFRRYSAGERRSGFIILSLAADGKTTRDAFYEVKHGCCGRVKTISHYRLTSYDREAVVGCADCTRKAQRIGRGNNSKPADPFIERKPPPVGVDEIIKKQLAKVFPWSVQS